MMKKNNYYNNLNFLRTIACICIIIMHIQANTDFNISGYIFNTIIPSWTWLVYLFMIISGFSMCCGYYKKIKNNEININDFYIKRFKKNMPFYSFLVVIAVIEERTFSSLLEGIVNLTMSFGLMPNNNPSVIGVGWTLQLIFLFYMLFPYFVFLIYNKRRAWFSFFVSLIINYACNKHLFSSQFVINTFTPRHSFIYTLPFFILGGLIFLYKDDIENFVKKHNTIFFIEIILVTLVWYLTPDQILAFNIFELKCLVLFGSWVAYTIGTKSKMLDYKIFNILGAISMEMYLSHMMIFRIIEKLGLVYIFGNTIASFIMVCFLEIVLLVIFITILNNVVNYFKMNKFLNLKG